MHQRKTDTDDHHAPSPGSDLLGMSPAEAARRLGIGRTLLYSHIKNGSLKTSLIGKRRIVTPEAIRDWLAAHSE